MFVPTVLAVLAAADREQCESRPAEANISVMASPLLHPRTHTKADLEANLIMGRYPVEFFRETRAKEGESFFESQYGNFCYFGDPLTSIKHNDYDHECIPSWPRICQNSTLYFHD